MSLNISSDLNGLETEMQKLERSLSAITEMQKLEFRLRHSRDAKAKAFAYATNEYRLSGDAHRPSQHQKADGHDPTSSDAYGYARPRNAH